MGFFDLFKKGETCARCNATVSSGEGGTVGGKRYCAPCYRRMQQLAAQQGGSSQSRQSSGSQGRQNSGGGNNRSFDDKYGDKYGKSSGPSTSSGRSTGSSSGGRSSDGYPATLRDIKRVLDETTTKYREESNGKQWEIVTGFTGKEKNYLIKFISTNAEDDGFAIRVFGIVSAERSQYARVYPVLNKLQDTYRFLRFTLDQDGDVNVEYDATCCGSESGMVALEMIVRITKILDDAYPELKRAAYL